MKKVVIICSLVLSVCILCQIMPSHLVAMCGARARCWNGWVMCEVNEECIHSFCKAEQYYYVVCICLDGSGTKIRLLCPNIPY